MPGLMTLMLPDLAATGRLAARLAPLARPGDALLLEGPLGAGKSAFARAFLRALTGDPALEVPSPSFTLVQSYDLPSGAEAHHYDLYRLDGPADLTELGWDEARQGILLVEWPERLGDLRPADALTLTLAHAATEDARIATLDGWADRLASPGAQDLGAPDLGTRNLGIRDLGI
ncbi:MAG: tRNA ((37)-N6)-threonylcarbamoyltransferase complex ATPase subunit type 1 TsaE [Belnapia sp.]|nr:tRNA ((37)-N6)-threonylcarbamoyltransferase complex ATPase subunit type 1 TsaE [Belnapia sp.]